MAENKENKWKNILRQYETSIDESEKEELLNQFVTQIREDIDKLGKGEPISECAIFIPGLRSAFDKKTGFAHKMSAIINPISTTENKSLEVRKTHSYILYTRSISKLRAKFRSQIEEQEKVRLAYKQVRLNGQRSNFCTLKKNPPSCLITHPTPMPVEIAPLEDLQPFFQYLEKGVPVVGTDKIEFTRGVHYNDGRIDLCKQVVGSNWIGNLMDSIKNNQYVDHFLLGNNIIDEVGATAIANFIKSQHVPKIKTWYLAGNRISETGIQLIADALKSDQDTDALWLKRNPLKPQGVKAVGELMEVNKSIKILDLHNVGALDEGIKYLFQSLKKNDTLRHLYLDANGITPIGCLDIANYFDYLVSTGKKGITSLWLDINRIDDDGAIILANSIKNYVHMKRLVIGSNRITGVGAKVIFESFVNHPNLIILDLGFYKSTSDLGELPNNIGDLGAEYAADFIIKNKKIKHISVLHNNISNEGLAKLSNAVLQSNNLLYMNYEQYDLKMDPVINKTIREKLKQNIKNNLGLTISQFMNENHFRYMKHTKKVKNIDSVYRNRM